MADGVYRRKDSKNLWIAYKGIDGRIVRKSSGTDKVREAQALYRKRKQAIREGEVPEVKQIKNYTFNQLAEKYLDSVKMQKAFRSKQGFIKQLREAFGNYPLRRINIELVEKYQMKRMEKGNKPATINRHLATLKHMFTKAVDWEMVEESILKKVRKVKLLNENNRRKRFLDEDEVSRLLSVCDNRLRPIVITALNTGMRKGEILSLKWDQVDMKQSFISILEAKNGERREVPINDNLMAVLKGHMRRIDISHVFINPETDKPYKDVKTSFKSALRRAKIHDFRFHDLRHTFASHMVMAGVDITTVSRLMGHKSLSMTLRYSHLAPAHKKSAVSVLDRSFGEFGSRLVHVFPDSNKKRATQNA